MCMFCAAIPMSASLGAALVGKRKERQRTAQAHGETLPVNYILTGKGIVAITGSLLVCSAVYHLVIMPHTGAVI